MADSPFIFDIDESNYEQIVLRGSQQVPVLVDFWATWCQPCQVLMPLLAQLVDEYNGRFILAKVNTEEQQAIAAQFLFFFNQKGFSAQLGSARRHG